MLNREEGKKTTNWKVASQSSTRLCRTTQNGISHEGKKMKEGSKGEKDLKKRRGNHRIFFAAGSCLVFEAKKGEEPNVV